MPTSAVRAAGSGFTIAGGRMATLQAEAPLGDAAAAVPELQTAAACNEARSTVAAEMKAIAEAASVYGTDLKVAADEYDSTDHAAGDHIAGVEVPAPAPR